MEDSSKSALIFKHYSLDYFDFTRNYNFDSEEEDKVELKFDLGAEVSLTEKEDKAKVTVKCVIFEDEFDKDEAPFYISTSLTGFFDCEGDIDFEKYQYNAIAILLPYLRSTITSFTSQAGISPVILPTMNVYKAFEKKNTE